MPSFKTTKKIMYSVPMDVRALNRVFNRIVEDVSTGQRKQEISDSEIEEHIYNADSVIVAYLDGLYGTAALSNETPYYKGPVSIEGNKSFIKLSGVTVGSSAITEQWLIEFNGETSGGGDVFTLWGSASGNQGQGNTATDFTATDGDITISSANWIYKDENDSAQQGDQIVFASYVSHPLVRYISSLLAAGALADVLYSEAESGQSSWGKVYNKRAMDILKDLSSEKGSVSLPGTIEIGPSAVPWSYQIDEHGRDTSKYKDISDDYLPYDW